jgi:hypothetical protein
MNSFLNQLVELAVQAFALFLQFLIAVFSFFIALAQGLLRLLFGG